MGGRKGEAKVAINQAGNLIALCSDCHHAGHRRHTVEPDGFKCGILCPRYSNCCFGQQVRGRPYKHIPPPWIPQ
jgi:hypothetical protein